MLHRLSPWASGKVSGASAPLAAPGARSLPGLQPLTPTIFHERWWLDAVTGGDYDEVQVRSGDQVVGRLPFALRQTFPGVRICEAPELCHALGPAIDVGSGNPVNRGLKRFQITKDLVRQLPRCSAASMTLHAGTPDTFAFNEAGYRTTVQFTFEIAPQPERAIWCGMRDKTRNVIRRAEERWEVIASEDAAAFAAFYDANLQERGRKNHYRRVGPLCSAAIRHGYGRILMARNDLGAPLAAIFVAWDHRAMYYLLSSRSADADNGAVSLLIWHAIKLAAAKNLVFDFDNVGEPSSRLFFWGFGGTVHSRFTVAWQNHAYRTSRWLQVSAGKVGRRGSAVVSPMCGI